MQTFLPLPDLRASLEVLDDKRLGKQRVETFQILRALTWPRYAWKNHPAVRMWRGFVPALVAYGVVNCDVWTARGYADTVRGSLLGWTGGAEPDWERLRERGQLPPWLGVPELHVSHQSALVRKDPEHYRAHFPDVPDDLPYWWPPDVFPRWPARRPRGTSGPLPVPAALDALGLQEARAGQAEGVEAVAEGRDVLATMRPGHGGSTTGLMAGLSLGHAVALSPAGDHAAAPGEVPGEPPPVVPPEDLRAVEEAVRGHAAGDPAEAAIAPDEPHAPDDPGDTGLAEDQPDADVLAAAEGEQDASARAAQVARPPSAEDRAAMDAEATLPPDIAFLGPERLVAARDRLAEDPPRLLVVDDADALDDVDAAAVRQAAAALGRPPVLALAGAAGPEQRERLAERLGLDDPVHVGGGFDRPGVVLAVSLTAAEAARRAALADAVRAAAAPGLVIAPDRVRAERLAAALVRAGLRAAAVAPGMRESRVLQAQGRYRTRKLAALVVSADAAPELGRAPVGFVAHAGPPADLDIYHAQLALARPRPGAPARATLLLTTAEVAALAAAADPGARALAAYAAAPGCRWAALLDAYGEPVRVPCGRCDRDLPAG